MIHGCHHSFIIHIPEGKVGHFESSSSEDAVVSDFYLGAVVEETFLGPLNPLWSGQT
jgi:hypothetical protein